MALSTCSTRLIVLAALTLPLPVQASSLLLYQDDFSGSAFNDLEGLAPDVRPGNEVWTMPNSLALRQWKADGTVEAGGFTNGQSSIQLPFTPEPGYVYKLRATIEVDGADLFGKWIGFGFSDKLTQDEATETVDGESAYAFSTVQGQPWAFLADWVSVVMFAGPQTDMVLTDSNTSWGLGVGIPVPLRIELDTTGQQWVTSLYRESDEFQYFAPYTFPTNPTIAAVGFTKTQGSLGRISNFSLESVGGATVPGDFDGDGVVDGADLLVWQQGGSPDPLSQVDFTAWETNFGESPIATSQTPEPHAATLAALSTILAAALRRRGD